ncbi:Aspercryptin biosynthesis cluster protein B [Paramyrothecium foliicola]|nr:Aspercryptin biosynthesis cluster protein B [Paramyrothecium foliicola]
MAAAARLTAARFLPKSTSFLTLRAMSTTPAAARKFEFLAVVPDKPGMQEKRLEVRPIHFAELDNRYQPGDLKMGGALLNSVPTNDDATSWDFAGSTIVCVAESKEEVIETLKQDVYCKTGVWDMDKYVGRLTASTGSDLAF